MADIANRNDIVQLMKAFYVKAFADELIGFYFTELTKLDLEKHLPTIADFWETVLLNTGKYQGDPIKVHQHIHELSAFNDGHFNRWVHLFKQTVDELFTGNVAERAKQRAESISTVMKIKLIHQGIQKRQL